MKLVGFLLCIPVFFSYLIAEVDTPPHSVIIYGIRGSGRATIGVKLRKEFSFPDISFASLLANHVAEETSLGKKAKEYLFRGGELPPALSLEILNERLSHSDCARGFLLEEFPLTLVESQGLYEKLSPQFSYLVVSIDVSDDWLIQRFQHRSFCRTCGRVYDEPFSRPKHKGQCDICGGTLHRRMEDSPDAIKSRLASYKKLTSPIIEFYGSKGVLVHISGDRDFDAIYQDIVTTITQRTGIAPRKLQASESECLEPECLSPCPGDQLGYEK